MPSGTAIDHERHRWSYMSFRELSIRLGKITKLEKLESFLWMCTRVVGGVEQAPLVSMPDVVRLHEHALQRADILGMGPQLRMRYPVNEPRAPHPQRGVPMNQRGRSNREVVGTQQTPVRRTTTGLPGVRDAWTDGPPPMTGEQIERQVARARQLWQTSNFFQLQRYVSQDFEQDLARRSLHDFVQFMRLMVVTDHQTRERECRVTPGEALELMRQATRRMQELNMLDLTPVMRRLVDEADQHLKEIAKRAKFEKDKTSMGARVIRVKTREKSIKDVTIDDLLDDVPE